MIRTKLITITREKIIMARTLLVRVSFKVIKYHDQKHEKGLFHFTTVNSHFPLQREVKTGTQSRNPEA